MNARRTITRKEPGRPSRPGSGAAPVALFAMALVWPGPAAADAALSVTMAADPASPAPGDVVTVTAAVLNQGPEVATTVRIDLDSSASFQRMVGTSPSCSVAPACQLFSCDRISLRCGGYSLAPQANGSVYLSFTFPATPPRDGIWTSAYATSTTTASGTGATIWVPPKATADSGGCSVGGSSLPALVALALALAARRFRSPGGSRRGPIPPPRP